jgi:DNA-binding response OmpR family regulator
LRLARRSSGDARNRSERDGQRAVVAGRLHLDPDLQLLGFEGRVVELTATETSVLHTLLLRACAAATIHGSRRGYRLAAEAA